MAALIVLLIVAGTAAVQYFKGTLTQAAAMVMAIICANIIAFSFFEVLSQLLITRSEDAFFKGLVPYIHALVFVLLFILSFTIFQTLIVTILKKTIDLGDMTEKTGRVILGAFSGFLLSGILITILVMTPMKGSFPYERFEKGRLNPQSPNKSFMNADGFITGLFNMVSSGSMSGKRSFAIVHPSYLDEMALSQSSLGKKNAIVTASKVMEIPKKNAAWLIPESTKTTDGDPVDLKRGYELVTVKIKLSRKAGSFTPSQLRISCNEKENSGDKFSGKGINVYPIGFMTGYGSIQLLSLNEVIESPSGTDYAEFVFQVPSDYIPVLAAFKMNNVAEIPAIASEKPTETQESL